MTKITQTGKDEYRLTLPSLEMTLHFDRVLDGWIVSTFSKSLVDGGLQISRITDTLEEVESHHPCWAGISQLLDNAPRGKPLAAQVKPKPRIVMHECAPPCFVPSRAAGRGMKWRKGS